ncbi:hypothetical protein GCM10027051_31400 [Niabella terrae]
MEIIMLTIYKFSELSPESRAQAITDRRRQNERADMTDYYEDLINSYNAALALFGISTTKYKNVDTGQINDRVIDLTGVRAYKWLINNYYNALFKPEFIKSIVRPATIGNIPACFVLKCSRTYSGAKVNYISRAFTRTDDCVLTGTYYDNQILAGIYDFLKAPTGVQL